MQHAFQAAHRFGTANELLNRRSSSYIIYITKYATARSKVYLRRGKSPPALLGVVSYVLAVGE